MHSKCIQRKRKQEKETFPPAPPYKEKEYKEKENLLRRGSSYAYARARIGIKEKSPKKK